MISGGIDGGLIEWEFDHARPQQSNSGGGYEVDWDLVGEIIGGILSGPTGCVGHGDDGSDNGSTVDTDGRDGEVRQDGSDADIDETDDDADADVEAESDADCVVPAGVNNDWAVTNFSSAYCDAKTLLVRNGYVLGVCDYSLNRVFACQIHSDPSASTTCSPVFTLEARSGMPDGTTVNNNPIGLFDTGDRLALIYDSAGDAYPNNLAVISGTTYARVQEDAALPMSMIYGSGSDPITVRTTTVQGAAFLGGNLFFTTRNFGSTMFDRGTLLSIRPVSTTDSSFNPYDIGLTFTNGRNPAGMAVTGTNSIVVLNAYGPAGTIPATPAPGEILQASIDRYDMTDADNPVITDTIPIAAVAMQELSELPLTADGSTAIVGSAAVPPTIYAVPLSGTGTVRQVTLPGTAEGPIASIAVTNESPALALVTLTSGQLFKVDLGAMAVTGEVIDLGDVAGPSVYYAEGGRLYQSVIGPNCGSSDESRIMAIDPTP